MFACSGAEYTENYKQKYDFKVSDNRIHIGSDIHIRIFKHTAQTGAFESSTFAVDEYQQLQEIQRRPEIINCYCDCSG